MAMMKAGLAGVGVGALALATVMFVPPIAAQGPGGPPMIDRPAPRMPEAPGLRGPTPGGPGVTGQDRGMMGRRGPDANDPDITGPRGEAGICQEHLTRMAQARLQRIERLVRPTDAQRPAFDELRAASAKALDIVRAACPVETPLTPPGRLELAEKRVEARLQAIKIMRPPLEAFYKLLSDEQKVRWSLGTRPDGFRGAWRERWGGPETRQGGHQGDDTGRERWRDDDRYGRGFGRDGFGRDGFGRDGFGRDGFGRDGYGRDGYGPEPRRRDPERWGERWRELDRPDPRWRNEYPGMPEEERP